MESMSMLTPREKYPLSEAQMRMEPVMLHHAGQRAQHTTDWAVPAPDPYLGYVLPVAGMLSNQETNKQTVCLVSHGLVAMVPVASWDS